MYVRARLSELSRRSSGLMTPGVLMPLLQSFRIAPVPRATLVQDTPFSPCGSVLMYVARGRIRHRLTGPVPPYGS